MSTPTTPRHLDLTKLPTKPYKAVAAFLSTELSAVGLSMLDGQLTSSELMVATGSALIAAATVWRTRNPVDTVKLGARTLGRR